MLKKINIPLLILALGVITSLGFHQSLLMNDVRGLHAWRQSQTMWNIRNFERHDANIMNPRTSCFNSGNGNILRMEFPIMQWCIGMVQKVLGDHIAIVRICVFLMGLLAVFGFYRLLLLLDIEPQVAALGAVLFLFSPLLHTYITSPLPDILALAGGVWYLYGTLKYQLTPKWRWLLLSGAALWLATAAKLPFLMFSIVSIYFFFQSIIQTKRLLKHNLRLAVVQLALVAPALAWYVWVIPTWAENPVMKGIFAADPDWENINKILLFYLNEMLPSFVLNSILVVPFIIGFFHRKGGVNIHTWVYPLAAITLLYAILQCTALDTYHDYYFLPFVPWMYVMVTLGIQMIGARLPGYAAWAGGIVLAVCVVVVSHNQIVFKWGLEYSGCNPSLFTHQLELKAAVPDSSLCVIVNDASYNQFSYMVDKMGYIFQDDYLPAPWIRDMIDNKQVTHMYSDSRAVDENPEVKLLLDTLLLEAGTIRVFRLVGKGE